jgi:hypothetical protein
MKDNQEDAQRVVDKIAQAALQDRSWMRNPQALADLKEAEVASRLTIVPIPADGVFAGTQFFAITDPTEKPGSRAIVIAITKDEQAHPIISADDFHQLILHLHLRIESKAEALQVAEQYVRIPGSRYPQYWEKTRILTSSGEIPLNPNETLPEKLHTLIQPPRVEEKDDGFFIQLFTWSELGGELKRFDFQLSKEDKIAVNEKLLSDGLGKAWLPK